MSDELKPCPFCGSTEVYVEEYEHHPGAMRWRVLCAGCMAGIDTGIRQSMGQAVQDWNRRAERTCHLIHKVEEEDDEFFDTVELHYYVCSECGWNNRPDAYYCDSCGARVIEEGT